MNLKTEFFLARRYMRPKRSAVSIITIISVIGVTLGVAVLIVVLAVMTGFTDIMKQKLLDTRAHLQVYSRFSQSIIDPERVISTSEKLGGRAIAIVDRPALIQRKRSFVPKGIIGIDPEAAGKVFNLKEQIKHGKLSLEHNEVIISTVIARELNLWLGDKLIVHSPPRLAKMFNVGKDGKVVFNKKDRVYLPEEYTISAIYSFGKYDFDRNIIFMGLDDADELFELPWGAASTVYIWIDEPFAIDGFADKLKAELPMMRMYTWKEINRDLLGVLQVEKNMMFFLMIFIVLVAAFSITNTLITIVYQKTREIGLLKALGASSASIMRIFIFQGFIVGVLGSSCGVLMGWLVVRYRNGLVDFISKMVGRDLFPKEFYFFNELPGRIVMSDLLIICISAVVLCTIGGIIPALSAAIQDPAKSLRNE
jgi:lipoprotein-releasing system permease protein